MKSLLSCLVAFTMIASAIAQEPSTSQHWAGQLTVGVRKLGIAFTIQNTPNGSQGTMDVPDQGAKNIPVEILCNSTDSLQIAIPVLRASFRGKKSSPQLIEGYFTQNGMTLPLNLQAGSLQINRPQMPTPPFPYKSEEVRFHNVAEGAVLAGTLTYPVNYDPKNSDETPVVLMVTGSGGQNRDEEVFGHKPFLVLADYLAKQGIATLRYDDRGVGESGGPTSGATTQNNLADAEVGINYLRSLHKFGKIGVLGHSEGGTIAFMMGANKQVDFVISLAGGAADGIRVIVGQNEAMMQQQGVPQELIRQYAAALNVLYKDRIEGREIADPSRYTEALCQQVAPSLPANFKANLAQCVTAGGAWLTWFLGYNPAEAIRRIACPVMAINGSLDMQVLSRDNLPVIEQNLPAHEKHLIKEYPALNHLFQPCSPATALNYGGIDQTISEEVLRDIATWIAGL